MAVQPFVVPWPLPPWFLIYTQSVGLPGRWISPTQGHYLHTGQPRHRICTHDTDIDALSGIRTHNLSVRASEDSSCRRPRGHRLTKTETEGWNNEANWATEHAALGMKRVVLRACIRSGQRRRSGCTNERNLYRMFSAQADWTLSHKDTEQSTIEASNTLNDVILTDPLIRLLPNE
jgi:hypothetical protein